MERRSLLTIVGTTAATGLAGCAATESDSDTQSTENEASDSETQSDTPGDDTPTEEPSEESTKESTQEATEEPTEEPAGSVSFTLDNVGASAWEITDSSENVGQEGTDNPTLTLESGTRYVITNAGQGTHPLAFRTGMGAVLLSQGSAGELEAESDINWIDNGETIEFTVTDSLASRVDEYYCTVHGAMNSGVQIEGDSSGY